MEFVVPGVTWEWAAKMLFGFAACVAGLMLWAHGRQPAWIFVILGTLLSYTKVLLDFVESLGLYSLDSWQPAGIPIARLAFAGGVPLLYAIGLFLAFRSFSK